MALNVADELNGGIPRGENSRRQLLHDMAIAIPDVRPAVISVDLEEDLAEFLRFRHLFRTVYGFVLQAERLRELEDKLPDVLPRFAKEVRVFTRWLATGAQQPGPAAG